MTSAIRVIIAAAFLFACASGATAQGDGSRPMAGKSTGSVSKPASEKEKEIRQRGAEYYAACMKDWEPATHMTKQEWARTCRSVADERIKFLLKQAE